MNWTTIAGQLARAGAPILGRAIGGPLGELIAGQLGGFVASSLGVEGTPEAVDKALRDQPADAVREALSAADAEAMARWPALADIARVEADVARAALGDTAATMRAEALSGDVVQRWWRPIYAFELTIECAVCWALAMWDLAFGAGKIAAWAAQASGLLSVYWGARFGVLGVYVNGRTREKEAAITGQLPAGWIEQILRAVRGRK